MQAADNMDTLGNKDARTRQLLSLVKVSAEQQSSRAGGRANSKRARAISLGFGVVVPKARA